MLTFKYHLRNLNSRWSVERHNIVFKLKCKMYFELTKKNQQGYSTYGRIKRDEIRLIKRASVHETHRESTFHS